MRILLVRLDGIGDAAVCVPLLVALRGAGHAVGVALSTRNAGLFAPHALLAEHVLERIPWPAHGSTPESAARARAEIAAVGYDLALIASEEPEAFALAAPLAVRVGFSTGWTRPLKSLWVRARTTRTVSRSQRLGAEDAHEVEVLYRLGAGFVASPGPPREPGALRAALLPAGGAAQARGEIVVQAGPKWEASGVSAAVMRDVLTRLAPQARIVAAPADAAAVRERAGVVPETFPDLRGWIDALGRAAVVVTVDSGAAHVAGMLGTRVVDVFPDAGFDAQVRRWHPWAAPYDAVRASAVDGGPGSRFIESILDGD